MSVPNVKERGQSTNEDLDQNDEKNDKHYIDVKFRDKSNGATLEVQIEDLSEIFEDLSKISSKSSFLRYTT